MSEREGGRKKRKGLRGLEMKEKRSRWEGGNRRELEVKIRENKRGERQKEGLEVRG